MPDSKRFLHPEAIKRISRLELRAQHIVEGFLSGMHRSPYFGESVEFLQHREYTPGDDLRHVDWQVWARQDRLYVKQYEADTNLRCHLLIDISTSMEYGNGHLNKFDYAATIAASLAYLVLKQQDAVGLISFDDQIHQAVPTASRKDHLHSIVRGLDNQNPGEKSDLGFVFQRAAEVFPRRGVTVIVSDFFAEPQQILRGLRLLRQRGHDVLVFHVMDDDELDFPFSGPTRFEDSESEETLTCNPRALREGYLQACQEFLQEMKRGCATAECDYKLVRTSDPMDAVLATYLSRRLAFLRGRK